MANPGTVSGEAITNRTRSLLTGSKIKVLGEDKWITTLTYYDKKARPIYVASNNEYLNTTDIIESELDFVGRTEETKTTHIKGSNTPITTLETYEYDHMGRIHKLSQKINDQNTEVIAENNYDALGLLKSKKVGGGLQDVDYSYNVRGWLKAINKGTTDNGALFGYEINYNNPNHGAKPLFNGNISETEWKTGNDNIQRWYTYSHDALNRILKATSNNGRYNVGNITYDKMGNILSLNRNGWQNSSSYTNMDVLDYDYDSGNKLRKVTDGGNNNYGFKDGTNTNDDFEYDQNGNMIKDQNKGITKITYNHLNLPKKVIVVNTDHNGNLRYVYDATGTKLQKVVTDNGNVNTTDYTGKHIYKNGQLDHIMHPEGYTEPKNDGSFIYVYAYKDLNKNTRLTYSDNDKNGRIDVVSEVRKERNHYPFGMLHEGYNSSTKGSENNHNTFQGQELNQELGLNWVSFKWRNADPSMGRFFSIDPLAEQYVYNSTFAFLENRVVDGIELEGLEYVSANYARLIVRNTGEVHLNFSNMTNPTKTSFNDINSNPQFWTGGNMGASHINTRVGKFNFGSIGSKLQDIRGVRSSKLKIQPPIAKSTGLPNRTFTKKRFIGDGPTTGAKEVRSAKALLAIEGVRLGFKALYFAFSKYDESLTSDQLKLLEEAGFDLNAAISEGLIPEENMNVEDLSGILQGIFSGSADDEDLNARGVRIYQIYNDNYSKEIRDFFKRETRKLDRQLKK